MRCSTLGAFLVSWTLTACPSQPAQMPDEHGEPRTPYPCQKDADCMRPSCGPCTPGALLVQESPACAVNPCPDVAVVCSPKRVCVVK
jgi:hypothetical protein